MFHPQDDLHYYFLLAAIPLTLLTAYINITVGEVRPLSHLNLLALNINKPKPGSVNHPLRNLIFTPVPESGQAGSNSWRLQAQGRGVLQEPNLKVKALSCGSPSILLWSKNPSIFVWFSPILLWKLPDKGSWWNISNLLVCNKSTRWTCTECGKE